MQSHIRQKITWGSRFGAALLALALAGCEEPGQRISLVPPSRPASLALPVPSAQSERLSNFYRSLQQDLMTRGLLREDGGGPDTPYDADDLIRNFEAIAFFDEHFRQGIGTNGALSKWEKPVRLEAVFAPTVTAEQRQSDQQELEKYAERLARITGHPVSAVQRGGNFKVIYAGVDDKSFIRTEVLRQLPRINASQLDTLVNTPEIYFCLVVAGGPLSAPFAYTQGVALIRAEHPTLTRRACLHEEVAQGLGLRNDSPKARPSIFNDDDEFARLTSHDELLLKMLYDPRLEPGMTTDEAGPIVREIAYELTGETL
ncbi:DUF2927 domain-containing protein [Epibacterium ulvae]|uniref:DUF2927 domain-containing protein n=1 Tax=Epibacterium ulvae TaxID=1156985 RepID=UPI001BFC1C8A|nr:DUF2927 domain-containing protein [Epibacterium ulvae]MBT8154487.1 DUF2927 domain-containing protein [Epibacterium ulvae]